MLYKIFSKRIPLSYFSDVLVLHRFGLKCCNSLKDMIRNTLNKNLNKDFNIFAKVLRFQVIYCDNDYPTFLMHYSIEDHFNANFIAITE